MKILKVGVVLGVLLAALLIWGKYYPEYLKRKELQERVARAEATLQRQTYLLRERQERSAAIPSVDPDASENEAKARWEAAKARGALPDQKASTGSTTTNSPQYSPPARR